MSRISSQRFNLVSNRGERFTYCNADEFRVGRGAMGEVFKGWYSSNPEYKVAIKKVYGRHAENPQIRSRARYEASLAIDHPNLIRMLGYCEEDRARGSIYIISELVRGETIDKVLRGLTPAMRLKTVPPMMCSALDALHCLHSRTPPVWHRDLKPSNIMVSDRGEVKVMDLGIATSEGISLGTLEGRGFGTYPYAPPEQITGRRSLINATSDIYSAGVTFYELLTGSNPFAGGSDVDIMEKQITMPLPYNPAIPKPLFKVLLKATAKRQQDRYQTSRDFKDAIINASKGKGNGGRGAGHSVSKRHPLVYVAAASLILFLLLIIILLIIT
ncbi:MAG: serine/threonine protein kinase [Tannerellaceae bacterium]|jgi:serine/threonine-protein kinase|nr:serine/threonine protein kinase [Tannerellaceae bacterium]